MDRSCLIANRTRHPTVLISGGHEGADGRGCPGDPRRSEAAWFSAHLVVCLVACVAAAVPGTGSEAGVITAARDGQFLLERDAEVSTSRPAARERLQATTPTAPTPLPIPDSPAPPVLPEVPDGTSEPRPGEALPGSTSTPQPTATGPDPVTEVEPAPASPPGEPVEPPPAPVSTPSPPSPPPTPTPEPTPEPAPPMVPTSAPDPEMLPVEGSHQDDTAEVVFRGRVLFVLRGSLGAFSAADRAHAVERKLKELVRTPGSQRKIRTALGTAGPELLAGDRVLLTLTAADTATAGGTPEEAAAAVAAALQHALDTGVRASSLRTIAIGLLLTVLATAVLVAFLRLLGLGFPRVVKVVRSWEGTLIRNIRIQRLELLSAARITEFLILGLRLLRLVLAAAALLLYFPVVFSFFPFTRELSNTLLEYLLVPIETVWVMVLDYLPNVFFLLVIGTMTFYGIRLVKWLFQEIERETISLPGFDRDWAAPTFKIVRFLILAFALVVAFPYLPGSQSPAFQGVSIFLGLLLSLSSSSAISNIVAGVILTYTRAFRLGDRVKIADTVGDVVEKSLLATHVRTVKNVDITVPNSLVLGSHIINYSAAARGPGLVLHTTVTIGYDVPWRTVHELLLGAARDTSAIDAEPAPFVWQTSLGDFAVSYELNAVTRRADAMGAVYSELHQHIQDRFNAAGVEIMSPAYTAVRDGNQATIPADYLPPAYETPGFRIWPLSPGKGKAKPPSGDT